MSPLHQEEEDPAIVSCKEFDLMTCVLDEQPILGNTVSGQCCIQSVGSLLLTLGARVPRNEWEHLRNISRSGSILLHCNQQTHLWHI